MSDYSDWSKRVMLEIADRLAGVDESALYAAGLTAEDLEAEVQQYLSTLLWATVCLEHEGEDADHTLDEHYDTDDIDPLYVMSVRAEIMAMVSAHPLAYRMLVALFDVGAWAHDFLLTREGHGAGFWDRFYGDTWQARLGDYWTDIAEGEGALNGVFPRTDTGKLVGE